MKLIHLSDLHIGKKVCGYSMLEDQKFVLKQILSIIDREKPNAVILAGDIYDKSVPTSDAVTEFDDFLYELSQRELYVFIISGNHDSPERLAFGARIMKDKNIYISPVYDGRIEPIVCSDEYGTVNFYLLPFIKPIDVKRIFPQLQGSLSYTDAVRTAVEQMHVDPSVRNVIVTHQFVKGASSSDSEEVVSVGGTDEVAADVFDCFDYTALGHIHGPQNIGRDTLRYCGTPLKYSVSEEHHVKSVTVVTLNEKGSADVYTVPLEPYRNMRTVKGSFDEVFRTENYTEDYVHVILTDSEPIYDAMHRLREIYPYIMSLENGKRTEYAVDSFDAEKSKKKSPYDIVAEFITDRGVDITDDRKEYLEQVINEIWGGSNETD